MEENADDVSGHKRSKIKSVKKTRVLRRSKKEVGEGAAKLSQSASDITAGEGLGSEEDLTCSQGTMGSRAMSHDSIFLADLDQPDPEPARVLSQENVHSKIKALQMKLQLQKMHLGPPPLVLPMRRAEDVESHYVGEGLPLSPAKASGVDVSSQGTLHKATPQPFCYPVSSTPRTASLKSLARAPAHILPLSNSSHLSTAEDSLDFSSVAQFTPCLDNSAARHRLSVKPKHQRASTKKRLLLANFERHTENNINHTQLLKGEEISAREGVMLEKGPQGTVSPVASQVLPEAPVAPEETSQPPSPALLHQYQVLPGRGSSVPSQMLRVKTLRPADVVRAERPHSSFIPSELKHRKEGEYEMPTVAPGKRDAINKAGGVEVSPSHFSPTSTSATALKSGPVQQQVQGEAGSARGIKRPGSGSFHFSITPAKSRDAERPRSGSFVGVLEQTEARSAIGEKAFSSMKEKGERKALQPRGGLRSMGVFRRDSIPPWEGRENGKKVESGPLQTKTTTELSISTLEEAEGRRGAAEEAMEAREAGEEEVKSAFGVKLRSTSQSFRLRAADASSGQTPKLPGCEERCEKQRRQEAGDVCSKQLTNTSSNPSISEDLKLTETTSSGLPSPVKNLAPLTIEPQTKPTEQPKEVECDLAAPEEQQQQPTPKTAPSEMSWMSLAMEKTRSFQQLLTGRFSRDNTGTQQAAATAARPQPQEQMASQSGEQTQVKLLKDASQPSSDALKAPQMTPLPSASSSVQTKSSSQPAQNSVPQSLAHFYLSTGQQQQQQQQQQPTWGWRQHPGNKSTTSASPGVLDAPLGTSPPSLVRSESQASAQKKEGPPPSGRRPVWTGLVSEKAAFLERQTEQTSPPGGKGAETTKAQAEERPVGETTVVEKPSPLFKDPRKPGLRPADSSPVKVPERPCEDKWLRKNVQSSSSPSSSPTKAPACQSTSDSGQPSWMELAKRKSMAWSDKSMD